MERKSGFSLLWKKVRKKHFFLLFIYLFIYLLIHLFIYLFIYLFICLFIYLFNYLFIYLFIYFFIYLFIYLFYLFIFPCIKRFLLFILFPYLCSHPVHLDVVRDKVSLEHLHIARLAQHLRVLPLLDLLCLTALLQLQLISSNEAYRAFCLLCRAPSCRWVGNAVVLGVLHGFDQYPAVLCGAWFHTGRPR